LVCPKPTSPNEQGSSPFDDEQGNSDPSILNPSSSSNDEEESEPDSDDDEEEDYHIEDLDVKQSTSEEGPDVELKGILDSIGDILETNLDESETSNFQYIGVAEDGHRSIDIVPTFPKYKRVLSYNTLFALRDAEHSSDTTKRMKPNDVKDWPGSAPTALFSSFSLGPPAMQYLPPLRDESPIISDEDDSELDRQLGSELDEQDYDEERDGSPVPLLTPPASPLTVVEVDGAPTTVCEWPSNLTVDSAMLAVNDLDPASLETSFENSERHHEAYIIENSASEVTTITPLLRSVYVG